MPIIIGRQQQHQQIVCGKSKWNVMIFSSCIFTILMMFDAASATVAAAAADETYNHSRDIIKH